MILSHPKNKLNFSREEINREVLSKYGKKKH